MAELKLGIVGACGRGGSFRSACDALEQVTVHAVCDIKTDELNAAAERLGAREAYTDFETMLDSSPLDAVVVGTPMPCHVPQAVAALEKGLHVLSEVPAAVSIQECRELVRVCKAGSAVYMMAENFAYTRPNAVVREMIRQGLFGRLYYAEGEYLHELKGLNEKTKWRRAWQNGIDGVTYGTHSLGPILQWFEGDRVEEVCCRGSGRHYTDPRGEPYAEDTSIMLCKMRNGGLVKIRVDMISDRPHAMMNYQLQGTDGCYESARSSGEKGKIWLRDRCGAGMNWLDLADLEDEFLPEFWKENMEKAGKAGHGGGDYLEILDFVDAVEGRRPPVIGIHEAMDITLPGLVSQASILEGGRWMPVPDSRDW